MAVTDDLGHLQSQSIIKHCATAGRLWRHHQTVCCVWFLIFFFYSECTCMHGNETSVIHKVLVNVSSEHAYLILCLCILDTVNIVLGSLPLPPFFFSSGCCYALFLFSLSLSLCRLYDSSCCGSHSVLCLFLLLLSLFCFYVGIYFAFFLWAHCALALSWGLCATEISCLLLLLIMYPGCAILVNHKTPSDDGIKICRLPQQLYSKPSRRKLSDKTRLQGLSFDPLSCDRVW